MNDTKEIEDNTMEFVKKKLLKKKAESKQKSNYLNFTNPTKQINIAQKTSSDMRKVEEKTNSNSIVSSTNNVSSNSNMMNNNHGSTQINKLPLNTQK